MTVPLSEAVANRDPLEFKERDEIGVLCACMMFVTLSERRSKINTSPGEFWDEPLEEKGELGEGTGDGYAR